MVKQKLAVLAACLLAGSGTVAFAAHGGGGGNPGGMSSAHMSSGGMSNTNGPDSVDRDKGMARATDRMSTSGAEHGKAHHRHARAKRHSHVSSAGVQR